MEKKTEQKQYPVDALFDFSDCDRMCSMCEKIGNYFNKALDNLTE